MSKKKNRNKEPIKVIEPVKTFEQFVAQKRNNRYEMLAKPLAEKNMPHVPGTNWKAWEDRVKQYQCSDSFKEILQPVLDSDTLYQQLISDAIFSDEKMKAEYEKYRVKAMGELVEKEMDERSESFMKYLIENEDMLVDMADGIAEDFMTDIRDELRSEVISFTTPIFDNRYRQYGSRTEDLTLDNMDDFIESFNSDIWDSVQENLLSEIDLPQYILEFMEENDSEQFQIELQKVKDGLEDFHMEWLRDALERKLYWEDRLANDLDKVEESLFSNYVYSSLEKEEIKQLLWENPHYKKEFEEEMRKQKEAEEARKKMEAGILERIPENPIDLFPLARKMNRHFVIHVGPTNSGKTHDALEALKKSDNGVYLAPLRLLAFECFERLNNDGIPCSMITGEEERIIEGAVHTSSTVELLDIAKHYKTAVIDEAQMITDKQRGSGWTTAILGVCADEIHICTAPQAKDLIIKLIEMCGDSYSIKKYERMVPLIPDNEPLVFPKTVKKNDALIVFSKAKVLAVAAELQRKKIPCSVIYGNLPYEARQNEVKKFIQGETDVIVATDAIGMGMNLPIKRIAFLELRKFDGISERDLRPAEAQQIAGRAGRKGMYDIGTYTCTHKTKYISRLVNMRAGDAINAVLGFTKNLIEVEGKLSEIIQRWSETDNKPGFVKADMSDQIKMCKRLEEYTDDKELIYGFITIPFDINNEELWSVWFNAFQATLNGRKLPFNEPIYSRNSLDDLEQAYKYCDLMYFYHRKFCDRDQLDEIAYEKAQITELITEILSKQALKGKKCRECGKNLPWDFPYPMCDSCHNQLYPKRYGYYDYDDEDWF